jgi:hypothetical protein
MSIQMTKRRKLLLFCIFTHGNLPAQLVFKGGTCLMYFLFDGKAATQAENRCLSFAEELYP